MNFIQKNRLKKDKKQLLFEVETDIKFIGMYKAHYLKADMLKLRAELATENKKEKQDQEKLNAMGKNIALCEAVKREYEKLSEMREDLGLYIDLL